MYIIYIFLCRWPFDQQKATQPAWEQPTAESKNCHVRPLWTASLHWEVPVYMYVRMYVCMAWYFQPAIRRWKFLYVFVCVHVCMHGMASVECEHTLRSPYTYVCMYVCVAWPPWAISPRWGVLVCMYVCMYVNTHTSFSWTKARFISCVCVCMRAHTFIYAGT